MVPTRIGRLDGTRAEEYPLSKDSAVSHPRSYPCA